MALYDRQCVKCATVWEVSCKISEKETAKFACPECGSEEGTYLLNAPAFSMKGHRFKGTKSNDGAMSEVYSKIAKAYPKSELAKRV